MNLTELRNKTKQITDYSPDLAVYNESLDGFINDAMNALWTERRWTFAQELMFLDIWPDVNPLQLTTPPLTMAAQCSFNSRRIQFSGSVFALDIPFVWEGQIFEIQGRDYKIIKVVSPTEIHLDMPFLGTSSITDVTWKIKHRFYDLPDNAIELLSLSHRDAPIVGSSGPYSPVRGLHSRSEEDLNLREDLTAFWSSCYIPVAPVIIPPGEKIACAANPALIGEFLFSGPFIEVCWAFEGYGGKVGPLSQPLTFVQPNTPVPATSITISMLSFDDVAVRAPTFSFNEDQNVNQFEGLRKRVYFNQNINRTTGARLSGLPVWREITVGTQAIIPGMPGVTTNTDPIRVDDEANSFTLQFLDQISPGNKRYVEWDGSHPRIRPYPRPIGQDEFYVHSAGGGVPVFNANPERQFRQWELRYYRKCKELGLATDSPEMPYEFHQLIVYKALMDIFGRHDNLAQAEVYGKRYQKEIERLEKRYVQHFDTAVRRGQFSSAFDSRAYYDGNSLRKTN